MEGGGGGKISHEILFPPSGIWEYVREECYVGEGQSRICQPGTGGWLMANG